MHHLGFEILCHLFKQILSDKVVLVQAIHGPGGNPVMVNVIPKSGGSVSRLAVSPLRTIIE